MATRKSKIAARANPAQAIDLLLLVPVDENDCFSREFDITAPECQRCHDAHACALAKQHLLRAEVSTVEKDKGPFLDQTRLVSYEQMRPFMTPGTSLEDLLSFARKGSVCPDQETITQHVLSAISQHRLRIKGGILCE